MVLDMTAPTCLPLSLGLLLFAYLLSDLAGLFYGVYIPCSIKSLVLFLRGHGLGHVHSPAAMIVVVARPLFDCSVPQLPAPDLY